MLMRPGLGSQLALMNSTFPSASLMSTSVAFFCAEIACCPVQMRTWATRTHEVGAPSDANKNMEIGDIVGYFPDYENKGDASIFVISAQNRCAPLIPEDYRECSATNR